MIQHKKAALIGAGEESLHTIEKAQELGVFVTALDGNPKAAGLQAADEGLAVDISREDEVIKALQEEAPDFVITGPIGRYLTTAGAVNDAFQLRGINRQSAVWCTDKYLFHEKLHAAGLRDCHCERVPAFCGKDAAGVRQIVDHLMKKAEEEFSFPAILKPRYGSGSRGIFFLNSLEELRAALEELAGENGEKDAGIPAACEEDYVLEEAVPGAEYGVDAALDEKILPDSASEKAADAASSETGGGIFFRDGRGRMGGTPDFSGSGLSGAGNGGAGASGLSFPCGSDDFR